MTREPTLIFLHGFMGNARDWNPVIARLKNHSRCVAVNLPVCTSFAEIARAVPDCRDAVLVGYSLGGRAALHIALRKKCRGLLLLSTSPGLEDAKERRARRARDDAWAARLLRESAKDFLDDWYAQPVFSGMVKKPRRILKYKRGLADMLRALSPGRQPARWRQLRNLNMPVLVVSGERDKKYVETGRSVARLCARGRHAIVPRSSHAVHLDNPARLARVIREYLNEVFHE